jgi:hypothetical protein
LRSGIAFSDFIKEKEIKMLLTYFLLGFFSTMGGFVGVMVIIKIILKYTGELQWKF